MSPYLGLPELLIFGWRMELSVSSTIPSALMSADAAAWPKKLVRIVESLLSTTLSSLRSPPRSLALAIKLAVAWLLESKVTLSFRRRFQSVLALMAVAPDGTLVRA